MKHLNGHTTNFRQTFIIVAEDSQAIAGMAPPERNGQLTVAGLQYKIIQSAPYKFTSDDVLFQVYAIRKGIKIKDQKEAREAFFSKGQPCFRASPLPKKFGWGVHFNEEGKIALVGIETKQYQILSYSSELQILKAMRSKSKR